MRLDYTTYVIDSARILKAHNDSINYNSLFTFDNYALPIKNLTNGKLNNYEVIEAKINTNQGHLGKNKIFTLEQDDGIFALIVICFLFFSRIYKVSFSFFRENSRLLFSSREKPNLFAETTVSEFWFNFVLVFQSIMLSSIILFDVFLEADENTKPHHSFITIVLFMLTISLFFLVKYIIYRILGYLFDLKDQIYIWIRSSLIVLEMVGIISFIPALILIYSQNYHDIIIVFCLGLFALANLVLFYRLVLFFLRENVNILFLITYLCSVEIIPYVILYQALVFLYKINLTSLIWL